MHFEIASDEGLPIRGNFDIPGNARALAVIIHGFKGFKDWGFFPWLAEQLCSARFAVCRFNMSRSGIGSHGESFDRLDLFAGDTYTQQLADLRLVIEHAQKRLPRMPLFLLGHSRGGAIALLGAAGAAHLHGVVAWSPIARADRWDEATKKKWREDGYLDVENARTKQMMRMSTSIIDDYDAHHTQLDVLGATTRLARPLLVVHGDRDESVPVSESRDIHDAARDASLVVIGGAGHTYNAIHPLVTIPRQLEYAAEVSASFINAYA